MKRISKAAFFETVGTLNVKPRVDVSTLRHRFHVSHLELRDRTIVGKTVQDSWSIKPTEFFVPHARLARGLEA